MFLSRHSLVFAMYAAVASLMVVAVAGADPVTNTLTWFESFDTYAEGTVLSNTNGWSTGAADVQGVVTSTASYDGANNCYLPAEGVLTNWINGIGESVVWFDFFAKIATRDQAPDVDPTLSAQFYFNENSNAVVWDGLVGNWVTLSNTVGGVAASNINPSAWTRVTVVHNYSDKKWALIVNDELLDDNIGFINTSITKMNAFVVSNQVSLDSMVASTNFPDGSVYPGNTNLVGDADGDGMADYWEINYFGYTYVESGGDDSDQDGRSSSSEFTQGTIPTDSNSFAINLAYRDGFESADLGSASGVWRGMTNYGSVTVQASDYIEGTRALTLSTGSVHVSINDSLATNVWVEIYSKPQPYAADPPADLDSSQVAGFLLATNGDLKAWSNNMWITCNTVTNVATNAWMGFAVHLDYNASNYDLYVSTNAVFGSHMKRAHDAPLAFNAAAQSAKLNRIVVTNKTEDPGYVDLIAASYAYTNVGVAALTNLVASDRLAGQANSVSRPPYNYELFDTWDDTLVTNSMLGRDLMRELGHYDTITVVSNGLNVYRYETNAPASWQRRAGENITNMHINSSMALTIDRQAGVDAVAFYPYSNLVSGASVFLSGTNTPGVNEGWNHISTHFDPPRAPADYGFYAPGLKVNDRIFFSDGYWLWYNGSIWKRQGNVATRTLGDETIWFYHQGTGMVFQTE